MDDSERPAWRMTQYEARVLQDLSSLAAELKQPNVPEHLLTVVTNARKGGQPWKVFRTLVEHGYLQHNPATQRYRRTGKTIPLGSLVGANPNPILPGAITRAVKLWKKGRRNLTAEDLKDPKEERISRGLPIHGEG